MRLPKNRRPTTPGEVFLEEFLEPLGITQKDAAARLHISYPRMNEIVNGKRTVTPDTALRLSKFTGTSAGFLAVMVSRTGSAGSERADHSAHAIVRA